MKRLSLAVPLLLITLIVSMIYWLGVAAVPFHPDESTQIYMSADLEIFFHNPADTFWQPQAVDELRQHYRLIDAPLSRLLIGLGRGFSNQPALSADWVWGASWEVNQAAGALPDASLLMTARLSVAWLFPFTLILLYKSGEKIGGARMGWIAFVLLASNSLVLLHTRRAMAESTLLFSVVFALYAMFYWKKHAWLAAIPLALAFNAKQSTAPLLLVGLLAIFLSTADFKSIQRKLVEIGLYLAVFAGMVFVFNPFLWQYPLDAAIQSWQERQTLVNNQVNMLKSLDSNQVLETIPMRGIGLLSNLYLTPPIFAETSNYEPNIAQSAAAYLSNPLHSLLRDSSGAGLLFALSVVGFLLTIRDRSLLPPPRRADLTLLISAGVVEFFGLVLAIPLFWQRYAIPLVPFACLFSAYCVIRLWDKIQRARKSQ